MLPQGSSSRSRVILDLSKYFGHNTPPKHLRLKRSTRLPAASRWRHVPPTQQPYDVPPNERVPCPTRRAGSVERRPPGDGSARSPGWRRIVPTKQLGLLRSTWPPAASRWLHALPTQQPYDLPAKERAPMNDSASGGLSGKGLLTSRGGG